MLMYIYLCSRGKNIWQQLTGLFFFTAGDSHNLGVQFKDRNKQLVQ